MFMMNENSSQSILMSFMLNFLTCWSFCLGSVKRKNVLGVGVQSISQSITCTCSYILNARLVFERKCVIFLSPLFMVVISLIST